jgi:predicted transposase YdaD
MGILEIVKMQERRDGEAEGHHKGVLEVAREMKKDKFPVETIAKLTKLSISEIESL